jgi:opine dehydrogenase
MKLAVLGAGPAGSAMAAIAAYRRHDVALWSPRGGGTRHILGRLETRGVMEGRWPVRVAADLGRAVDGADSVLVCLPPVILPTVLQRLAAVLTGAPNLFLAPPGALAPLLLSRLVKARGLSSRVGALAAPAAAAKRDPDGAVRITAVRLRLHLAGLPEAGAGDLAIAARKLFGLPAEPLRDVLAAALADPSAAAGAARLLAPPGFPGGAERLLDALAGEWDELARAAERDVPPLADMVEEQGGLPETPPEVAQVAAGLSFAEALGRATRTPMPVASSLLRTLEIAAGRPLGPHPVMAQLDAATLRAALA